MKLKTLIIVLLLILGLAYAGAKGYIYYKVKHGLDKLIALASPVVQISYNGIGSELSGSIFIENVHITPTGTYDEVTVQQVKLAGKDYKFLLGLAKGSSGKEIPPEMSISFLKLQMPTTSSFLSDITSSLAKHNSKKITTCSIPGILGTVGLKELAINSISIDGNIGYTFDQDTGQATYNLRYNLDGIESSLLKMRLSQLSAAGVMGMGQPPVIEEVHMARQFKPAYMQNIVKHCAASANLSTAAFIEELFTQSDDYYLKTMGFIPGPGLSKLFRQLITDAGTIEINATPSSAINPAILNAYRPEDLADLLGVTASYNGNPVTDLSFSMQASTPKPRTVATPSTVPTVKATSPKPQRKPKPRLLYLETDISELSNYINYIVRVYTINNTIPKQGVLISVDNYTANIEHLVFSGKETFHLNIDRIEKLEVLRREESTP